ncbi:MAG: glycosyltransferase family 4 protein [Nitrospirae bacterium]|nr:glycosyltransferase family 4 protein [Nitrospirota bacterium]
MRAIINGIPLLSPRSGVGNYVYQNFKAMLTMPGQWQFYFYYGLIWTPRLKDQIVEPYVSARRIVKRLGNAYPAYRWSIDRLFRIGQKFQKYDLYHETNYIPMPFDGPTIITVFDLSFYLYRETHPIDRIRHLEKYFYPRLNLANHFITISEASRQEMVKHLGLPLNKITVTYLGFDDYFKPVTGDAVTSAISQYGLQAGFYILCLGTLEPRKNITAVLQAYAMLPKRIQLKYPLVLAGGKGWLMDNLEDEIRRLGIASTTVLTGYVPREHLPALYSGAAVFVYPSLYEGFGLPPLEAMACGTPVITSNVSSLPEVVGDAGIMVDPYDVKRLRDEIKRVLEDSSLRASLGERGVARAKQFTWENCARQTLDVYKRVMNKSG